jgi:hypothetical protein
MPERLNRASKGQLVHQVNQLLDSRAGGNDSYSVGVWLFALFTVKQISRMMNTTYSRPMIGDHPKLFRYLKEE